MASILDKYGIKEVADVTFYKINDDGSRGDPVLYLDTLKVSTIEQTAEEAEARGGKGYWIALIKSLKLLGNLKVFIPQRNL